MKPRLQLEAAEFAEHFFSAHSACSCSIPLSSMFANCGHLKIRVAKLIKTSIVELREHILNLGRSSSIDLTALTIIEELHDELSKCDVRLMARRTELRSQHDLVLRYVFSGA